MILRFGLALVFLVTFSYFANLSLYHSWAGSLPVARHDSLEVKNWHLYWANFFQNVSLFSLLIFAIYVSFNLIRLWRNTRDSRPSG